MHKYNYFAYPGLRHFGQYRKRINAETILTIVCKYFEVDINQLRIDGQKKDVVRIKMFYYILAQRHSDTILKEIGRLVNREHSTVSKAIHDSHDLLEIYPEFQETLNKLDDIVKSYEEPILS